MGADDEPKFLRSNVIAEPLVDRFYASLHTVAPVQAAMNLANLQVPLLESYLRSPHVHFAASTNPKLRGGYFIGIEESRSGEVADLLKAIRTDRTEMLALAAAVAEAEQLLRQNATGFDLTPLYPRLPEPLRGITEIAYDTSNQPTLRFLEPLAYHGTAYDERRQLVQLSLDNGVERPFILSTPRLPSPDVLELPLPFKDDGLHELFKARIHATTTARLREALRLDDAQAAWINRLLDDKPSLAPDRNIDAGARIRYYGHACLVLQTAQAAIITDPFISTDNRFGDRYTLDDLPAYIDLVLITHGHPDHVVLETLLQLRDRIGAVVVPRTSKGNLADTSIGQCLRQLGFSVIETDDFDTVDIIGGTVTATPFIGEHADLDIRGKSTYWIRLHGKSIYVGADSSGIDPALYRQVRRHLGPADLAFIGMECDGAPLNWLYKGLFSQPVSKQMSDSRKLSGSNAAQAGDIMTELGASEGYVYAMGEESWQGHIMATSYTEETYQQKQIGEFLTWCADRGIAAEHLFGKREWRWM